MGGRLSPHSDNAPSKPEQSYWFGLTNPHSNVPGAMTGQFLDIFGSQEAREPDHIGPLRGSHSWE
jgi:hypothetical protein